MTNAMDAVELKNEDLEKVSGGVRLKKSTAKSRNDVCFGWDSQFLNVLLRGRDGQCDRYGSFKAWWHMGEIEKAWASVGIEVNSYGYLLNGQRISRDEAMAHAESVVGIHLQESDWNW